MGNPAQRESHREFWRSIIRQYEMRNAQLLSEQVDLKQRLENMEVQIMPCFQNEAWPVAHGTCDCINYYSGQNGNAFGNVPEIDATEFDHRPVRDVPCFVLQPDLEKNVQNCDCEQCSLDFLTGNHEPALRTSCPCEETIPQHSRDTSCGCSVEHVSDGVPEQREKCDCFEVFRNKYVPPRVNQPTNIRPMTPTGEYPYDNNPQFKTDTPDHGECTCKNDVQQLLLRCCEDCCSNYSQSNVTPTNHDLNVHGGSPRHDGQLMDSCSCPNTPTEGAPRINLSNFSVGEEDIHYLERVRQLLQNEQKLKKELDDLARMERCTEERFKNRQTYPEASGSGDYEIQNLKKLNQKLEESNSILEAEIEQTTANIKHLRENVEEPMKREIEQEKKKIRELEEQFRRSQCELETKRLAEEKEIEIVRNQLQHANKYLCDLNLVNKRLKEELCMLNCRCNELQTDIINQKLSEIHTLSRLCAQKRRTREHVGPKDSKHSKGSVGGRSGSRESSKRSGSRSSSSRGSRRKGHRMEAKGSLTCPKELPCPKKASEKGDGENDLTTIARNLSKLLLQANKCNTCQCAHGDLIDTVKYIKDLVDLVNTNRQGPSSSTETLPYCECLDKDQSQASTRSEEISVKTSREISSEIPLDLCTCESATGGPEGDRKDEAMEEPTRDGKGQDIKPGRKSEVEFKPEYESVAGVEEEIEGKELLEVLLDYLDLKLDEQGRPVLDAEGRPFTADGVLIDVKMDELGLSNLGKPEKLEQVALALILQQVDVMLDENGKPILDEFGRLLALDGTPIDIQVDETGKPILNERGLFTAPSGRTLADELFNLLLGRLEGELDGQEVELHGQEGLEPTGDGIPQERKLPDGVCEKPAVDEQGRLLDACGNLVLDDQGRPLGVDGTPITARLEQTSQPALSISRASKIGREFLTLLLEQVDILLDEEGQPILDEQGRFLTSSGVPIECKLDEEGMPILDEQGRFVDSSGQSLGERPSDISPEKKVQGEETPTHISLEHVSLPAITIPSRSTVSVIGKKFLSLLLEQVDVLLDEEGRPVLDEQGRPLTPTGIPIDIKVDEEGRPVLDERGRLLSSRGRLLEDELRSMIFGKFDTQIDEEGEPILDKLGRPLASDGTPLDIKLDEHGRPVLDEQGRFQTFSGHSLPFGPDSKSKKPAQPDEDGRPVQMEEGRPCHCKVLLDKDGKPMLDETGHFLVADVRPITQKDVLQLDEQGKPVLDEQGRVLTADGTSIGVKLDEYGQPVLDEQGRLQTPSGHPVSETAPKHVKMQLDDEGKPVLDKEGRVVMEDGTPIEVKLDEHGQPVLDEQGRLQTPSGHPVSETAPKHVKMQLDEEGKPVLDKEGRVVMEDGTPIEVKLDEHGQPVLDEHGRLQTPSGHPVAPPTAPKHVKMQLDNEGKPVLDKEGRVVMDDGTPVKVKLDEHGQPVLDEQGRLQSPSGHPVFDGVRKVRKMQLADDGRPIVDEEGRVVMEDGTHIDVKLDEQGQPILDEQGRLQTPSGHPVYETATKPIKMQLDDDGKPILDKEGHVLKEDRTPIEVKLDEYGQPVLDEQGRLQTPSGHPVSESVPKPLKMQLDDDGKPIMDEEGRIVMEDGTPVEVKLDEYGQPILDEQGRLQTPSGHPVPESVPRPLKMQLDDDGKPILDKEGRVLMEDGTPIEVKLDEHGQPLLDEQGRLQTPSGHPVSASAPKPLKMQLDDDGKPILDKEGRTEMEDGTHVEVKLDEHGQPILDEQGRLQTPSGHPLSESTPKPLKLQLDDDGKPILDKEGRVLMQDGTPLEVKLDEQGKPVLDEYGQLQVPSGHSVPGSIIRQLLMQLDDDGKPILDEQGRVLMADGKSIEVKLDDRGQPVLDEHGQLQTLSGHAVAGGIIRQLLMQLDDEGKPILDEQGRVLMTDGKSIEVKLDDYGQPVLDEHGQLQTPSGHAVAGGIIRQLLMQLDDEGKPILDEQGRVLMADGKSIEVKLDDNGQPVLDEHGQLQTPSGHAVAGGIIRQLLMQLDDEGKPILDEQGRVLMADGKSIEVKLDEYGQPVLDEHGQLQTPSGHVVAVLDEEGKLMDTTSAPEEAAPVPLPEIEDLTDIETPDDQVKVISTLTDGAYVTTAEAGAGTLHVTTEGPAGLIDTTVKMTASGNFQVLTDMTEYGEEMELQEQSLSEATPVDEGKESVRDDEGEEVTSGQEDDVYESSTSEESGHTEIDEGAEGDVVRGGIQVAEADEESTEAASEATEAGEAQEVTTDEGSDVEGMGEAGDLPLEGEGDVEEAVVEGQELEALMPPVCEMEEGEGPPQEGGPEDGRAEEGETEEGVVPICEIEEQPEGLEVETLMPPVCEIEESKEGVLALEGEGIKPCICKSDKACQCGARDESCQCEEQPPEEEIEKEEGVLPSLGVGDRENVDLSTADLDHDKPETKIMASEPTTEVQICKPEICTTGDRGGDVKWICECKKARSTLCEECSKRRERKKSKLQLDVKISCDKSCKVIKSRTRYVESDSSASTTGSSDSNVRGSAKQRVAKNGRKRRSSSRAVCADICENIGIQQNYYDLEQTDPPKVLSKDICTDETCQNVSTCPRLKTQDTNTFEESYCTVITPKSTKDICTDETCQNVSTCPQLKTQDTNTSEETYCMVITPKNNKVSTGTICVDEENIEIVLCPSRKLPLSSRSSDPDKKTSATPFCACSKKSTQDPNKGDGSRISRKKETSSKSCSCRVKENNIQSKAIGLLSENTTASNFTQPICHAATCPIKIQVSKETEYNVPGYRDKQRVCQVPSCPAKDKETVCTLIKPQILVCTAASPVNVKAPTAATATSLSCTTPCQRRLQKGAPPSYQQPALTENTNKDIFIDVQPATPKVTTPKQSKPQCVESCRQSGVQTDIPQGDSGISDVTGEFNFQSACKFGYEFPCSCVTINQDDSGTKSLIPCQPSTCSQKIGSTGKSSEVNSRLLPCICAQFSKTSSEKSSQRKNIVSGKGGVPAEMTTYQVYSAGVETTKRAQKMKSESLPCPCAECCPCASVGVGSIRVGESASPMLLCTCSEGSSRHSEGLPVTDSEWQPCMCSINSKATSSGVTSHHTGPTGEAAALNTEQAPIGEGEPLIAEIQPPCGICSNTSANQGDKMLDTVYRPPPGHKCDKTSLCCPCSPEESMLSNSGILCYIHEMPGVREGIPVCDEERSLYAAGQFERGMDQLKGDTERSIREPGESVCGTIKSAGGTIRSVSGGGRSGPCSPNCEKFKASERSSALRSMDFKPQHPKYQGSESILENPSCTSRTCDDANRQNYYQDNIESEQYFRTCGCIQESVSTMHSFDNENICSCKYSTCDSECVKAICDYEKEFSSKRPRDEVSTSKQGVERFSSHKDRMSPKESDSRRGGGAGVSTRQKHQTVDGHRVDAGVMTPPRSSMTSDRHSVSPDGKQTRAMRAHTPSAASPKLSEIGQYGDRGTVQECSPRTCKRMRSSPSRQSCTMATCKRREPPVGPSDDETRVSEKPELAKTRSPSAVSAGDQLPSQLPGLRGSPRHIKSPSLRSGVQKHGPDDAASIASEGDRISGKVARGEAQVDGEEAQVGGEEARDQLSAGVPEGKAAIGRKPASGIPSATASSRSETDGQPHYEAKSPSQSAGSRRGSIRQEGDASIRSGEAGDERTRPVRSPKGSVGAAEKASIRSGRVEGSRRMEGPLGVEGQHGVEGPTTVSPLHSRRESVEHQREGSIRSERSREPTIGEKPTVTSPSQREHPEGDQSIRSGQTGEPIGEGKPSVGSPVRSRRDSIEGQRRPSIRSVEGEQQRVDDAKPKVPSGRKDSSGLDEIGADEYEASVRSGRAGEQKEGTPSTRSRRESVSQGEFGTGEHDGSIRSGRTGEQVQKEATTPSTRSRRESFGQGEVDTDEHGASIRTGRPGEQIQKGATTPSTRSRRESVEQGEVGTDEHGASIRTGRAGEQIQKEQIQKGATTPSTRSRRESVGQGEVGMDEHDVSIRSERAGEHLQKGAATPSTRSRRESSGQEELGTDERDTSIRPEKTGEQIYEGKHSTVPSTRSRESVGRGQERTIRSGKVGEPIEETGIPEAYQDGAQAQLPSGVTHTGDSGFDGPLPPTSTAGSHQPSIKGADLDKELPVSGRPEYETSVSGGRVSAEQAQYGPPDRMADSSPTERTRQLVGDQDTPYDVPGRPVSVPDSARRPSKGFDMIASTGSYSAIPSGQDPSRRDPMKKPDSASHVPGSISSSRRDSFRKDAPPVHVIDSKTGSIRRGPISRGDAPGHFPESEVVSCHGSTYAETPRVPHGPSEVSSCISGSRGQASPSKLSSKLPVAQDRRHPVGCKCQKCTYNICECTEGTIVDSPPCQIKTVATHPPNCACIDCICDPAKFVKTGDSTPVHPPDCACVDCLCDPNRTFTREVSSEIRGAEHRIPCNCEECICAPCADEERHVCASLLPPHHPDCTCVHCVCDVCLHVPDCQCEECICARCAHYHKPKNKCNCPKCSCAPCEGTETYEPDDLELEIGVVQECHDEHTSRAGERDITPDDSKYTDHCGTSGDGPHRYDEDQLAVKGYDNEVVGEGRHDVGEEPTREVQESSAEEGRRQICHGDIDADVGEGRHDVGEEPTREVQESSAEEGRRQICHGDIGGDRAPLDQENASEADRESKQQLDKSSESGKPGLPAGPSEKKVHPDCKCPECVCEKCLEIPECECDDFICDNCADEKMREKKRLWESRKPVVCNCTKCRCNPCRDKAAADRNEQKQLECDTGLEHDGVCDCWFCMCKNCRDPKIRAVANAPLQSILTSWSQVKVPDVTPIKKAIQSWQSHPSDCTCHSCMCDPCKKDPFRTYLSALHGPECTCPVCVCGSCPMKDKSKHKKECNCERCVCDPCEDPIFHTKRTLEKTKRKDAGKHPPDCDCPFCRCDPCNDPKHGPGCKCPQCFCDPCSKMVPDVTKSVPPPGKSSELTRKDELPTKKDELLINKDGLEIKQDELPIKEDELSTKKDELSAPPGQIQHGPDCQCAQCLCQPCFDNTTRANEPTKESHGGTCICSVCAPLPTQHEPNCQCPLCRCEPCFDEVVNQSKPKHGEGCLCPVCAPAPPPPPYDTPYDFLATKHVEQERTSDYRAHGPNCRCDKCMCEACDQPPHTMNVAKPKHPHRCKCDVCACQPRKKKERSKSSDEPHKKKKSKKHGSDCNCTKCKEPTGGRSEGVAKGTKCPGCDCSPVCVCDTCPLSSKFMGKEALRENIRAAKQEKMSRRKEMEELEGLMEQIRSSCDNAVEASRNYPTGMGGPPYQMKLQDLQSCLKDLEQKCENKDRIIEAMADELRMRDNAAAAAAAATAAAASIPFSTTSQPVAPPCGVCTSSTPLLQIKEVKRISSDSVLVKWSQPCNELIIGYEVTVDNVIRSRVHSAQRTSAVVFGMKTLKKSLILVHAVTQYGRCEPPATYHLE